LVNAAHILGLALLIGAIATLDLRVLGAFARQELAVLGPPLRRVAGAGLALAAATGFLLFSTRPLAYAENPAFLAKLGLVGVALLNIGLLHASGAWRRTAASGTPSAAVRVSAGVSLLCWVGAVLAGRWIGFLQ
jgi:hypothetical protein